MKRVQLSILGLILAVSVLAPSSQAADAYLYLAESSDGSTCGISDVAGIKYVYVIARPISGVTAAQFSVPIPSCVPGMYRMADMPVYPVTIGNSETGISIGFGTCKTSSDFHILTILYFMPGTTEVCCPFPILPDPYAETGQVQFVDCDFNLFTGTGWGSYVSKTHTSPPLVRDPSPGDGVTERPLDTKLSWSVHRCDCYLTWHVNEVFFGTTPEPPSVVTCIEEDSYDPGPLQPSTTYYWKIKTWVGSSLSTTTPVWSFSTVTGVPAEKTTWGRVKSLYTE